MVFCWQVREDMLLLSGNGLDMSKTPICNKKKICARFLLLFFCEQKNYKGDIKVYIIFEIDINQGKFYANPSREQRPLKNENLNLENVG